MRQTTLRRYESFIYALEEVSATTSNAQQNRIKEAARDPTENAPAPSNR